MFLLAALRLRLGVLLFWFSFMAAFAPLVSWYGNKLNVDRWWLLLFLFLVGVSPVWPFHLLLFLLCPLISTLAYLTLTDFPLLLFSLRPLEGTKLWDLAFAI